MEVTKAVGAGKSSAITQQPDIFYRITALWAMSEAFLGGVLHAFHLPGTGLFVGGAAVLCISLLAHFCPNRNAILKATILVLVLKGILSPHTPPGAYLAVFIQGGLGYLLFRSRQYFKISCFALGILTQLQSALQRLVVMVIMFGADIYQVAHGFINYILKKAGMPESNYVLYVVVAYIVLHALMGVLVGWLAGRLPQMLAFDFTRVQPIEQDMPENMPPVQLNQKKFLFKRLFSIAPLTIAALLAASLYFNLIPYNTAYSILLRAVLIFVVWTWVLSPLFKKVLSRWRNKKHAALASEVEQVMVLMPFVRQQAYKAWASLSSQPLHQKLLYFPANCLALLLKQ